MTQLNKHCEELESTLKSVKAQNKELEYKTNDLEARSMRENLLFYGLNENKGED